MRVENTQRTGVQDLITEIDAYIASQLEHSPTRPASRGTMFIDFTDGGLMQVSYRHAPSAPAPATPPLVVVDSDLNVRVRQPAHSYSIAGIRVDGVDRRTGLVYDYDGRVVHLHCDSERQGSLVSEYWAVEAEEYAQERELVVKDRGKGEKEVKMVAFIRRLLKKLDGLGIMGWFKAERGKAEKLKAEKLRPEKYQGEKRLRVERRAMVNPRWSHPV